MKKAIILIVMSLLVTSVQLAFAADQFLIPGVFDLAESDAIEIATQEATGTLGLTQESLEKMPCKATFHSLEIYGVDTPLWTICFFDQENGAVYAVMIESPSGRILHAAPNFFWGFADVWEQWGYAPYMFLSPEEKAFYHSIFQLEPTTIYPDIMAIPYEKAIEITMNTISGKYGLSIDSLESLYGIDGNYKPAWHMMSSENLWVILLQPLSKTGPNYQVTIVGTTGEVNTYDRNDEANTIPPSVYGQ